MTTHEATFFLLNYLRKLFSDNEASEITDSVMENVTGSNKTERMMYKNAAITEKEELRIKEILERLKTNEPLQYILGEAWFGGMKFIVNKNVLIPRPETDELVQWIIKDHVHQENKSKTPNIIDIGTGSGCIPVTLKKKIPIANVSAIDVCSEAIFTATENALNNDAEVNFLLMDFLDETRWKELGQYDIIVSNPPYVRRSEQDSIHSRVKDYEPHLALFVPDDDPLLFYKKIVDFSKEHLTTEGSLYFEINESLPNEVSAMLKDKGFKAIEVKKDLQGKDRMIKALT